MAINLFDYGTGIDTLAAAIPRAIEGYQDQQARERTKQELAAKLAADEERKQRQMFEGKVKTIIDLSRLRDQGLDVSGLSREGTEVYNPQGLVAQNQGGLIGRRQQQGLLPGLSEEGKRKKELERQTDILDLDTKRQTLKDKKIKSNSEMRKEWQKDDTTKRTKEVSEAYGRVQAVTEDPSAAGDLALIFNFMKMLDPRSVVRESEFQSAAQARAWLSRMRDSDIPVPGSVVQGIQKLQTGKFLLPEQRKDFVRQASNLYKSQLESQKQTDEFYTDVAASEGLDPSKVVRSQLFREPLSQLSEQDQAAKKWAEENPDDPRAKQILQMLPE